MMIMQTLTRLMTLLILTTMALTLKQDWAELDQVAGLLLD